MKFTATVLAILLTSSMAKPVLRGNQGEKLNGDENFIAIDDPADHRAPEKIFTPQMMEVNCVDNSVPFVIPTGHAHCMDLLLDSEDQKNSKCQLTEYLSNCPSICNTKGCGTNNSPPPTAAPNERPTSSPTFSQTSGSSVSSSLSPTYSEDGSAAICVDDTRKGFDLQVRPQHYVTKYCPDLVLETKRQQKMLCNTPVHIDGTNEYIRDICKETCGKLGKGECKHLKDPTNNSPPTDAPTDSPTTAPTDSPTSRTTQTQTTRTSVSSSVSPTKDSEGEESKDGSAAICVDDTRLGFEIQVAPQVYLTRYCPDLVSETKKQRKLLCNTPVDIDGSTGYIKDICKETCGKLGKGECKHLKD